MRVWFPLFLGASGLLSACGSSTGDATDATDAAADGASPSQGSDRDASVANLDDGAASQEPQQPDARSPDAGVVGVASADAGPPPARPSAACAGNVAAAATGSVAITYEGTVRSYLLHLPTAASTAPRPLVVSLHPYTGSGAEQESLTGMSTLADTAGFVVTYPDGLGSPADWNAGACCSAASEGNRDDEGFLGAVIDDIAAHVCVDLSRVYVAGFSNGGMMTVRLACEMANRFAAAATVSGSAAIPLDMCKPSRPIPFMHIHGTADTLVPYDGGAGGLPISGEPTPVFPAVAQEVATFRSADGCPAASDVYFDQGSAQCDHWGPCTADSEVIFCTIDGGTHAWPANPGSGAAFSETSTLDATTQIWRFLQRHALP